MTTQYYIKKWLIYGLVSVPIWALDCYVLGRYPIYGATPLLFILMVTAVATMEGQMAGGCFGTVMGVMWEATYTENGGMMILFLALFGSVSGAIMQYVLQRGFFLYFLASFSALALVEISHMATAVARGAQMTSELPLKAGLDIALTLAYAPIVYLPYLRVYYKITHNAKP